MQVQADIDLAESLHTLTNAELVKALEARGVKNKGGNKEHLLGRLLNYLDQRLHQGDLGDDDGSELRGVADAARGIVKAGKAEREDSSEDEMEIDG